jgi:hypothetical protein
MTKENPFKKAIASRHVEDPLASKLSEKIDLIAEVVQPEIEEKRPISLNETPEVTTSKKRGRPATGKRSDDLWIGRTYYIQRETDLDIEDQLLRLKRQGVEIDKSELVDFLLSTWVKSRKGELVNFQISEITPMRK